MIDTYRVLSVKRRFLWSRLFCYKKAGDRITSATGQQHEMNGIFTLAFAFLGHEVGTAKGSQYSDAGAHGHFVSVLVASLVVRRQHRGVLSAVAENGVLLFWVSPALEQAATIGEARQAYTEDDCCCDYEFLHRILCFIVVF